MTGTHSVVRRSVGVVFAAIALAACTSSGASLAPGVAASSAAASSAGGASVTVGTATSATLGTYLTGPNGMTLYMKTTDTANTSTCSGQCLANWPPLTVSAGQTPAAGSGVTGTLGTHMGSDGKTWVTYNGLPLYYWVKDTKPGDTTGQGVGGFLVASASGAPAGGAPASSGGGRYGGSPGASGAYSGY
jgi:predicted lipoprotein with Yx(FWY)xxD motif